MFDSCCTPVRYYSVSPKRTLRLREVKSPPAPRHPQGSTSDPQSSHDGKPPRGTPCPEGHCVSPGPNLPETFTGMTRGHSAHLTWGVLHRYRRISPTYWITVTPCCRQSSQKPEAENLGARTQVTPRREERKGFQVGPLSCHEKLL